MRSELRFRPPHLELTPELEWVLLRAYAPPDAIVPPGSQATRARLAQRLGLSTRIASRFRRNDLVTELGQEHAERFSDLLRRQAAYGLGLASTQSTILEQAARLEAPIVLLKFAALLHLGVASVTSRPACDLDLLVRSEDLLALSSALERAGFRPKELRTVAHQPVVMYSSSDVSIEFHVHLPYIRTAPGLPPATLDALRNAKLLEPADGKPDTIFLPVRSVLLAHLVAHGMVQHGFQPTGYPAPRLLSDAVDMGLGKDEALLGDALRWVRSDLSQVEMLALGRAAEVLSKGRVREVWSTSAPEELLIRHCIASMLDQRYQAQLRLRGVLQLMRERGMARAGLSYLGYAFALPEANLKKIYPNSRLPLPIMRLVRPADFLLRGIRVLWRASVKRSSTDTSGDESDKPRPD